MFGESKNDVDSIRELLVAANASLQGQMKPMLTPPSLTAQAGRTAVGGWVKQIAGAVEGVKATGEQVRAVVVHRDADCYDANGSEHQRLTVQLAAVAGHPVVPVQMIEAWWFLFPDAVEAIRPGAWRNTMPRRAVDVERINAPKVELMRLTRRSGKEYAEADSVAIAQEIRSQSATPLGVSASYDRLQRLALQI